jgi:hypothetical protein
MVLVLVIAPTEALASAANDPVPEAADGAAQEQAEEHGDAAAHETHALHRNGLSVFLGNTTERVDGSEHNEQGFTFGVEYFRRITPRFSLGGVLERAGGDIRGTLLIAQAYYKLTGGLFVIGGPGVEFRDAHTEEPVQHGVPAVDSENPMRERDTTVFLVRIGALYEFELGQWLLVPTVAIDFIGRDEALVLGASVGYVF